MEEHREESEFVGDFREPMEEAGTGRSLSSKTETLDGDVDVLQKDTLIEDANTVEVLDSGVCDGGPDTGDESLKAGDGNTGNSVSDEKQRKVDLGSVEDMVGSVSDEERSEKAVRSDYVERADAITELETERNKLECEGDAGTVGVNQVDELEGSELCNGVQRVNEPVKLVEVEMKDDTAMFEIKKKNGESHESAGEEETITSAGNEVTDETEKCKVEDNSDPKQNVQTEKSQQSSVDGETLFTAEKKADQEKESTKKCEDNIDSEQEKEEKVGVSYNKQRNSECETSDAGQEKESAKKSEDDNNKMDIDSKQANEENVGLNEQGNPRAETKDAKHLESAQVPEESTQLSKGESNKGNLGTVSEDRSAAEKCHEEEITNVNQKEENGEAMEIDYAVEGQVKEDFTVGVASVVQTQDVPVTETDGNDSNVVKETEFDERKDNVDMATARTIESADSANSNSPSEDAATGEVEPLDHNSLFDPSSDITNFIDFSGVSSWSGNIQDLKTETGDVSLKENKKSTNTAEVVATVECKETVKAVDATVDAESHDDQNLNAEGFQNEPSEAGVYFGAQSPAAVTECQREASDAIMGSDDNQEDKDHGCVDKKLVDQQDAMRVEDDITHEAPSIDPNQKDDTEMEQIQNNSDYADDGTDSYIKTNGVKRKADVLSEDSREEGRKTVSLAKVSFAQRPSFKIGACIARAASQMAGSPAVLKGSNFGDQTLSVESFVSQLHRAATDPAKENVVSDIGAGFFLDFRNSTALEQVPPEKASSKRGRPSNSSVGGTEAFEFEEMGDTYWTDKVIHNGGEEQTPTEKGNYQVVPVELKPAQVQRTRRPYRKRQSQISIHLPASDKPGNFDENAPAELIINFSETDTIPPEKSLTKMFRHFGPVRELQTEVDRENNRARVVFKKGADGKVAYNSAGRFAIFGMKAVNYELSNTITETFKVQPYVVSLAEEDSALCLPSEM